MNKLITNAYFKGSKLQEIAKNEIKRIKSDQRGMELLQIIIIILIALLVATALWTLLNPLIHNMLTRIRDSTASINPIDTVTPN